MMLAACSAPKGETVLRLGHDQTDGHPYDLAAERVCVREGRIGATAVLRRAYGTRLRKQVQFPTVTFQIRVTA